MAVAFTELDIITALWQWCLYVTCSAHLSSYYQGRCDFWETFCGMCATYRLKIFRSRSVNWIDNFRFELVNLMSYELSSKQ